MLKAKALCEKFMHQYFYLHQFLTHAESFLVHHGLLFVWQVRALKAPKTRGMTKFDIRIWPELLALHSQKSCQSEASLLVVWLIRVIFCL